MNKIIYISFFTLATQVFANQETKEQKAKEYLQKGEDNENNR